MVIRRARFLLYPAAAGLLSTAGIIAQPLSAQAVGAILGRVLEDVADAPVPGAAIEVLDARGQVVRQTIADSSGQFVALITRASAYRLRATRIGHAESLSAPIEVRPGDTLHVILRMDVQAIALPALEVVSRSRNAYPARLEGFEHRLERGLGTFIRREDIVSRAPSQVSDLLQEHGITVEQRGGHRAAPPFRRNSAVLTPAAGWWSSGRASVGADPGGRTSISASSLVCVLLRRR